VPLLGLAAPYSLEYCLVREYIEIELENRGGGPCRSGNRKDVVASTSGSPLSGKAGMRQVPTMQEILEVACRLQTCYSAYELLLFKRRWSRN
jgi:hypothetical protein